MKTNNQPATKFKILALAGMLLFISHYGYGQQSLAISFEPVKIHEIVITRMPSLSAGLFGRDFVMYDEREPGFKTWMIDESYWLLKKNISVMEFEFEHAEKELALEAWMTQTFKLEDRMLEEDLVFDEWMLVDTDWFEMN